jgi:uridylate kinase
MSMVDRVVIKLGGATLFKTGGFQAELNSLLDELRGHEVFVIVGGGELVEAMRAMHRIYPALSQAQIHWRCIELLRTTCDLAHEVMPMDGMVRSNDELQSIVALAEPASRMPRSRWVQVESFYRKEIMPRTSVDWHPSTDWNTTTDALAWLLGMTVQADRVILMKQCKCDPGWSLGEAATLGVVDTEIARLQLTCKPKSMRIELRSGS